MPDLPVRIEMGQKEKGGVPIGNNQTFSPEYCNTDKSITEQLQEGIGFFGRKYPDMEYLAYFQAYTNTYGDLRSLQGKYEEALSVHGVVGLIIGTRPDCMSDRLLSYLSELSKKYFVLVEYGIESTCDETLRRINRGHTFSDSADAVMRTANAGVLAGAHMILGLPGEDREMIISHAERLSQLPLVDIEITSVATDPQYPYGVQEQVENPEEFHLFDVDEYIDLVIDFIEHLRPDITVERFVSQSPDDLLIAPKWGLKNHEFTARLLKRMLQRNSRQGKMYVPSVL